MLAPVLSRQQYDVTAEFSAADRAAGAANLLAYRTRFDSREMAKRTPLGRRLVSLELFQPGAVKSA